MSCYYQSRNEATAKKQSYGTNKYQQQKNTALKYGYGLRNNEEKMMRNLFSCFDNDGDGRISKLEFIKMLSSLGYIISFQDVSKMINSFDQNDDDDMDFTEFMNLVKYLKSKGYKYGKDALENKIRKAFRYAAKVWS